MFDDGVTSLIAVTPYDARAVARRILMSMGKVVD